MLQNNDMLTQKVELLLESNAKKILAEIAKLNEQFVAVRADVEQLKQRAISAGHDEHRSSVFTTQAAFQPAQVAAAAAPAPAAPVATVGANEPLSKQLAASVKGAGNNLPPNLAMDKIFNFSGKR